MNMPQVGDGATMYYWSDSRAGTVVKVTPKTIHVQEDIAIRTNKNGLSETQKYEYTPNPYGPIHIFRMTKRGWSSKGLRLGIGHRRTYIDPSF